MYVNHAPQNDVDPTSPNPLSTETQEKRHLSSIELDPHFPGRSNLGPICNENASVSQYRDAVVDNALGERECAEEAVTQGEEQTNPVFKTPQPSPIPSETTETYCHDRNADESRTILSPSAANVESQSCIHVPDCNAWKTDAVEDFSSVLLTPEDVFGCPAPKLWPLVTGGYDWCKSHTTKSIPLCPLHRHSHQTDFLVKSPTEESVTRP